MSTLVTKNVQVGTSATASQNFLLYQPSTPDGTARIAYGASGSQTDVLTVTNGGNVGIGTNSPGYPLQIVGSLGYAATNQYTDDSLGGGFVTAKSRGTTSSPSAVLTGDSLGLFSGGGYNGSAVVYNKAAMQIYAAENWTTTANGTYLTFATTSNGATGRSERMRIDSSGNVGIGTSSPLTQFHATTSILISSDGGYYGGQAYYASNAWRNAVSSQGGYAIRNTGGVFTIWTGASSSAAGTAFSDFNERARIDSSGNLYVGTTTPYVGYPGIGGNANGTFIEGAGSLFLSRGEGQTPLHLNRGTSSGVLAAFYYGGYASVGNISITSSVTTYNTSSDYRLKEDIQPMTGALAKVSALKPVTYKWKADNSGGEGFIAHELQEVVPQAVTGEKDAVDKDGNPIYQGIDTSHLVATLTAAIQELKAELDTVKAELQSLKG